jgi:sterol 3beta-glucosyltransferase
MGGAYNYITYVMFDNVFWKAVAGQVNRWRKRELGLQATNLEKMQPNKVPFLYNFSPSVVIPPLDYSDWIRVTGYWFLDEGTAWTPPKELSDFIKKARDDGKKLVYVGFGSIVVQDSAAMTNTIIKSILKADVRCILAKGWSDRLDKKDANEIEVPLPPEILSIKSAPHDWLFKQIDAAAHHGGAGTTGASLRAGVPTIIKPFFGDQYFFGSRVEDLGVGIHLRKLNVSVFSRALWEACNSQRMIVKAKVLGETIRKVKTGPRWWCNANCECRRTELTRQFNLSIGIWNTPNLSSRGEMGRPLTIHSKIRKRAGPSSAMMEIQNSSDAFMTVSIEANPVPYPLLPPFSPR